MEIGLAQTRSQAAQASPAEPAQSERDDIKARVKSSGSSFYWAMRLLPEARRDALFAIYAFCREVDDIADGDLPQERKISELSNWHEKIDDVFKGRGSNSITSALIPAITTYQLRKEDFHAVVDGMEMDARGPIVAPTSQVLNQYCDRVASAVGRLCVRTFGESTPAGDRVADHLGRALQLTNIMRDVKEDSAIGRLYLPLELLQHASIAITSPADVIADPKLPQVMETLGQHAEDAFIKTQEALTECSKNSMRPAIIMMMVYRKHLRRLRNNGWRPLPPQTGFARVGARLQKFWIAIRYGFL